MRNIRSRNRPSNNVIPIYREIINTLEDRFGFKGDLDNSDLKEFYSNIKDFVISNELEGMEFGLQSPLQRDAYKRLKIKFKNRLLMKLVDSSQVRKTITPYANTLFRLNLEYAAFNVLCATGSGRSAAYVGELIITNSIKYEINKFVVPVATYLVEYFSIFNLNEDKSNYYIEIAEKYSHYLEIERQIHVHYSRMMSLYVKEFSPGEKALEIARITKSKYSKYIGKIRSVYFHVYYYLILVFTAYSQMDFLKMDKSAQEGLDYMMNLPQRRKPIEYVFLNRRIEANLMLGNNKFCKELLKKMLDDLIIGHNNWFNTLEILSTLHIHEKEYHKAITTFIKGRKNKNLETVRKLTKTRWGLLEAYINFLQLAGAAPESPTMSRYRINKFINNTPQYSEDKKGRNIQLIIAQLLFYIIDKNWDKMEEKIDALQRYGTRYLRKNELFRSQVFIKMLLEIPRRMYHPRAIIRHTARYRKRLEEMAPNIDLNGSTLEIIPYEHLWELIIQNIVPPKYTRKTKLTESV